MHTRTNPSFREIVILIITALLCVCCSLDGNDPDQTVSGNTGSVEILGKTVGSIVTYEEEDYEVVRNDFLPDSTPKSMENTDLKAGYLYADMRNDVIAQEADIHECIILFNLSEKRSNEHNDIPSLVDEYLIIGANGDAIAQLQFVWQASEFPRPREITELKDRSARTEASARYFRDLTQQQIRSYPPETIKFSTLEGLYGANVQEKIRLEISFNRDEHGWIDYSHYNHIWYNQDFRLINGVAYAPWRLYKYPEEDKQNYALLFDGTRFARFSMDDILGDNPQYQLRAYGDGKIHGSTSEVKYAGQNKMARPKVVQEDGIPTLSFMSRTNRTGELATTREETTRYQMFVSSVDDAEEKLKAYGLDDFYRVGEKDRNGIPSLIMRVPFADQNAPYQKYLQVTFHAEPSETDGEYVYRPDTESFIKTYVDNFDEMATSALP